MRHVLKLFPVLAAVLALVSHPVRAEERYLDAMGRIQVRYDSLDELKPLLALTVSSPGECPGAAEIIEAVAEPFGEGFASLREFEATLIAEGDERLTNLLADTTLSETFRLTLWLGHDAVYPVLLFPTKSEHEIANQTLTMHKFTVPYSGGQEIAFSQCSWGAHGRWGYVTVPQLGELIGQALVDDTARLVTATEPGELASATLYFENVPMDSMRIVDMLCTTYFEFLPGLMQMSEGSLNIDSDNEALTAFSGLNLYSALVKDLRAICEGVRQFTGRVVLDRETGDLVLVATTEYRPDSDLARQNNIRREHRQTLAGFYQPDDAIFAFAEGVAPRLEEQSFLVSLGHLIANMNTIYITYDSEIRDLEERIESLKNPDDTAKTEKKRVYKGRLVKKLPPTEDVEEIAIDENTTPEQIEEIKKRHPELSLDSEIDINIKLGDKENAKALGELKEGEPLVVQYTIHAKETVEVEQTLEELEAELEQLKAAAPAVRNFFEKTLFPSLRADWQEFAVTVDKDATVFGAIRVTEGHSLAELVDVYLKKFGDDLKMFDEFPAEIQTPEENYKGYRFFCFSAPIPEAKPTDEQLDDKLADEMAEHLLEVLNDDSEDITWRLASHKRAEWLDGKSFSMCLAVSDDVAAVLWAVSDGDLLQRMKDAIDRNETERNFPETVLAFSTPTAEQIKLLAAVGSDDNWWDDAEINLDDWPTGKVRVQSTLTDGSRTDRLRVSRELLAAVGKAWYESSGITVRMKNQGECDAEAADECSAEACEPVEACEAIESCEIEECEVVE